MPTVALTRQTEHGAPAGPANRCTSPLRRVLYAAGIGLAALLLSACAQQREPGFYTAAHDNTQSDAQGQAQGRTQARAPAQLQLGFGQTQADKQAGGKAAAQPGAQAASRPRALAEPKTFLGTLPCMDKTNACQASRLTLTLAPDGEWRARTAFLDTASTQTTSVAEQGCWSVIGTHPLRIVLLSKNKNPQAAMTFVNDNLLHIDRFNDNKPTLDYRLTRQADIDAIDELADQKKLQCQP